MDWQRMQVVETLAARDGRGHICDTLRRLAHRDRGDHFVFPCIDGGSSTT
jgi:hypothetical protein